MDTAVTEFSNSLYSEIVIGGKGNENVFISPWSIFSALSMTVAGADGNTKDQMLRGMALTGVKDNLHEQLGKWQHEQAPIGSSDVTLSVANRLYVENSYQLLAEFVELVKTHYHAPVEKAPFKDDPTKARLAINEWVEKQTHSKIKDFLSPNMVDKSTRLILVNAVYFKGKWLEIFKPEHTKPGQFHCLGGNSKEVQMMFQKERYHFAHLKELKVKLLWMPFKDEKTKLLIVLPDEKEGIVELEKHLQSDRKHLHSLLNTEERYKIDVRLFVPRLKLETSCELKNVLGGAKLQMSDMFTAGKANFSKMTSGNDLAISAVVHKAFFEMDEEGAEAAAATAIMMVGCCAAPSPPMEFHVDHPFMLFLMNEHNTPLFMGRVVTM